MSTELTWQTVSTSSENTERLAEQLGSKLRGGEVIELVSDLGGGKTTFVRGLAKGMGSHDRVSSPTFTLTNEYDAGKLRLFHYDFYRLSEAGIMADEIAEAANDPQVVVVVEWGDIVDNVLPAERLTVRLEATGENDRRLTFRYPKKLSYLIEKDS
ncbi:MAG TPA: tRNA (adenosine(37)-N6)-threonylcarbamoyltransferase complex ATPase subunit type 1 TsaE [Candidatus Saccharimonadales bacterium]|nr:tRNA (adenosine(37)-N6)-threonylcarbamoyltransferase complex ATPase subunit type 1 TsaE [Candidatus Saccharimonadales bacterium]